MNGNEVDVEIENVLVLDLIHKSVAMMKNDRVTI